MQAFTSKYQEQLDRGQLFQALCAKEDMSAPCNVRTYQKGEFVYLCDQPAQFVYFIHSGKVKLGNVYASGKEITKSLMEEGDVFGEMLLAGETHRRDFAQAIETTKILILPHQDLQRAIRQQPGLSQFFLQLIGERMFALEHRMESLVFMDSRSRVIEFVHQMASNKGRAVGFEIEVKQSLTHQEIAGLTATSRQTVTTVLNELRNKNLISFNRRRMLVRDMEALVREIQ